MAMKQLTAGMALCLCLGLFTSDSAYSASNFSYTTQQAQTTQEPLQGQVIYVPAGLTATGILMSSISSETASVGSPVTVTIPNDITYNGATVAQRGSVLTGTIVTAKKAGIGGRNGQLQVVFNNLRTPQGYNIAITAVFKTEDNTGILKGGTKLDTTKDYGKNAAVGAGAGAALGTAMGALAGGSVGKGAVYGTAIGAGIGTINAARQKGEAVEIPANAALDIYFKQPITVSAPSIYNY